MVEEIIDSIIIIIFFVIFQTTKNFLYAEMYRYVQIN